MTAASPSSIVHDLYPTPLSSTLATTDLAALSATGADNPTTTATAKTTAASAASGSNPLSVLPLSLLAPTLVSLLLESESFGSDYSGATGSTYALTAYAAANALNAGNFAAAGASLLLQGATIDAGYEAGPSNGDSETGSETQAEIPAPSIGTTNAVLAALGLGAHESEPSLTYLTAPPSLFETLELHV